MAPSETTTRSIRHRGLLSVKDTVESVVVAFILAFAFRAFVAEAFVIPTGSMAPNLYGVHRTHTCTVCGSEYAYGFSPMIGGQLAPPGELVCANCGYRRDKQVAENPDNGDRIFVLKWLFDVGRALPQTPPHGPRQWWHIFKPCRWDVVVFKDPNDGTTNFIKRLIGLPGEVLEIIDGDIYTASASELASTAAGRSVLEKLQRPRRYNEPVFFTTGEQAVLDLALKIQRKTDRAQEVLWLTAYHHDFLPVRKRDLAGWKLVDKASGWDTHGRQLRFDPGKADAGRLQEIAFVRGKPEAESPADGSELPSDRPVVDVYAYNGSRDSGFGRGDQVDVSDVRLSCVLIPHEGHGQIALSLSKRDDRFVATFMSEGKVHLTRSSISRPREQPRLIGETQIPPLRPDRPVQIALSNVDYRVVVRVEGRPVLQTADGDYPAMERGTCLAAYARQLRPDASDAAPEIRIGAAGARLELWHVAIDRDVYYRTPREQGRPFGWGVQGMPIYLRDQPQQGIQEYYCLGDNSPLSKDSRLWTEVGPHLIDRLARGEYQLGTVPYDQMIGRAFFVYWPAGFPLVSERLPLIPNVGDMRLIR
jgi:signal peptidase I